MKAFPKTRCLTQQIRSKLTVCGTSLLLTQVVLSPYALAEPTGGHIVGGSGQISQSDLTTTIQQNSQRLAIDWDTFNINANETVNFNQPSQTSIALNRILDTNPTEIQGVINANGQIIIANPNGVLFTKTASVNVGGLFAAALSIDPDAFMKGSMDFKALENTSGVISNEGTLQVIDGGTLALLGQQVRNEGLLVANFGTVALATGHDISVRFETDSLYKIQINQNRLADILKLNDPNILNSGIIQAHGGNVVLTATQASQIQSSIYKRDESRVFSFSRGTVVEKDGEIFLAGPDGDISNLGDVDVSDRGNAGTIIFDARNINNSGNVLADSTLGDGGKIQLAAKDTTLLTDNSKVSAQSTSAKGGTVHLLGNKVGMIDTASITTDAAQGGGEILVGGDLQGKNPDIQNAEAVYLGEETSISADATENGDGGKIIVWSDDRTRAYGKLSAKGGTTSGDGGFIETSSHNYVDLNTDVDVSSVNGKSGEWLIDPSNISIQASGATTVIENPASIFTANSASNSVLLTNTLESALTRGASITVQTALIPLTCPPASTTCTPSADTSSAESTGGNINLNAALNLDDMPDTGTGGRSLTLNAHHNININAQITETGNDDYLNLTLNADRNNSAGGAVNVNQNINLAGGNLIVTGASFNNVASITTDTSNTSTGTSTGSITIAVDNTANLGNLITDTDGGNLIVTAGTINGGVLDIAGTTTLSSVGTTNLSNSGNKFGGDVIINRGSTVTLTDADNLQLGNVSNVTNLNATAQTSLTQAAGTSITTAGSTTLASVDNAIVLRNITAANLIADASTGVSQVASTSLAIANTSDIRTLTGNIDLSNTNNNLGNDLRITNSGAGSNIFESTTAINLRGNVAGALSVTSTGGDISNSGALTTGTTSVFSVNSGNSILLDNTGNTLNGTINFLTNNNIGNITNLTVRDTTDFTLQSGLSITGDMDLQARNLILSDVTLLNPSTLTLTASNGNITQSSVMTNAGQTILSATGDIFDNTMTNNLVNNLANVQILQANNATINNGTNALNINGANVTNNLAIRAQGGITEAGVINVGGQTTLDAGTNAIVLDTSTHQLNDLHITSAGTVQINEANNINLAGTMDSLNITTGMGGASSDISNSTGLTDNSLNVTGTSTFILANGGNINLLNTAETKGNKLQGLVTTSATAGTLDSVNIRNESDLQLAGLTTSSLNLNVTDSINTIANAYNITQTGAFNVTGTTQLEASNISLNAGNNFTTVNITDSNLVSINDTLNGLNIIANNTNTSNTIDLTVTATDSVGLQGELLNTSITTTAGNISSTGSLLVAGNTVVDAQTTGNIEFLTNPVQLTNLTITRAFNAIINEDSSNGFTVVDANIGDTLNIISSDSASINGTINNLLVNAGNTVSLSGSMASVDVITTSGDIQNGAAALSVSGTTQLDAGNTDINLNNNLNNFNNLTISNTRNAVISAQSALNFNDVNVQGLTINTQGDITQTASTTITASGAATINSGAGNITLLEDNAFNQLAVTANNASIVNNQTLTVNNSSVRNNLNITSRLGSLTVNQITAGNLLELNAANQILDGNGAAVNLIANKAILRASNGIGSNATNQGINTQVARLEAHNTTSGDITINNTGADIILDSITNGATDSGNFNLTSTDDVYIDNITLQQHLVEAFVRDGGTGTVDMFTSAGSFLGVGEKDINNPDITATNLRLVGPRGTAGTIQRPLVLDISGKVELTMRASLNPIYAPPAPAPEDIQDESIFQFTSGSVLSAVNGVQVTEVETLLDISPAIFTDIRHFVANDNPVLLPRDQWFENGYTDEDDDEYFERIDKSGGKTFN